MVFEKNKQLWFLTYFDWFCGLIPTGIPVLVEFSINRGVRSIIFITLFLYLCNSLIKSSARFSIVVDPRNDYLLNENFGLGRHPSFFAIDVDEVLVLNRVEKKIRFSPRGPQIDGIRHK